MVHLHELCIYMFNTKDRHVFKPRPSFAWQGFLLSLCVCVRPCVHQQYISKSIEPINFIFGEGLFSDPGRKPFEFEKNCPGVRVGVEGSKFGPNHKR